MDVNTERIMAEIRDQIAKEREQTVDIEAIMREIRAQIAAEGIKEQIPAFSPVTIDRPADCAQGGVDGWEQFMQSLRYVNESYEIPYYWELGSANLKTFIKRLIRKLLKFLLAPIVVRQNEFNAHMVRCLNSMRYFMEEQQAKNQKVRDLQQHVEMELQDLWRLRGKEEDPYRELDYPNFQDQFRGARDLIKARQEIYIPYFENRKGYVLDIGCGRGEFLQLLKEKGITAKGVDIYPEYVVDGKANGLDVQQGNGIEYLERAEQEFGGIFLGQVIEHISFEELMHICKLAYQKLEQGACLIMETPNPASLSTFTSSFYVDPTHNKPIHPLTLEYILREVGFTDVQTLYTACSRPEQLPLIEGEGIKNLEEINKAIGRVSNMLYGSQDYAVIAKK